MPPITSFNALLTRARLDTNDHASSATHRHNPRRLEALLRVVYAGADGLLIQASTDPELDTAFRLLREIPAAELQAELLATRVYVDQVCRPASNRTSLQTVSSANSGSTSHRSSQGSLTSALTQYSNRSSATAPHVDAVFYRPTYPPDHQTGIPGHVSSLPVSNKHYCPGCRLPTNVQKKELKRHMWKSCGVLKAMASQNWFGCPYCPTVAAAALKEHRIHLYNHHVHEDAAPTPDAMVRLRNLTQQDPLVGPMGAELQRRMRRPDAWQELVWSADNVVPLTKILEIGQTSLGWPQTAQGYNNASDFVTVLLNSAFIGGQSLNIDVTPMAMSV